MFIISSLSTDVNILSTKMKYVSNIFITNKIEKRSNWNSVIYAKSLEVFKMTFSAAINWLMKFHLNNISVSVNRILTSDQPSLGYSQ